MVSPEREESERQVRATMGEGARVRERALRELSELDRVLKHDAAPPPDKPRERDKERRWWRRFLFA